MSELTFKGTPGKWAVNSVNTVYSTGETYMPIANVGGSDKNEKYHNSNLIAAAPELLEALQNLVAYHTPSESSSAPSVSAAQWALALSKAKTAIYKALNQ